MRQWQEKKLENLVGGITDFVENAKPNQLADATNLITNKEGILVKRDGTAYNKTITSTGDTTVTNSWEMEGFIFVITKDNRCFYINTETYDDPLIPWTELKGPLFLTHTNGAALNHPQAFVNDIDKSVWVDFSHRSGYRQTGFNSTHDYQYIFDIHNKFNTGAQTYNDVVINNRDGYEIRIDTIENSNGDLIEAAYMPYYPTTGVSSFNIAYDNPNSSPNYWTVYMVRQMGKSNERICTYYGSGIEVDDRNDNLGIETGGGNAFPSNPNSIPVGFPYIITCKMTPTEYSRYVNGERKVFVDSGFNASSASKNPNDEFYFGGGFDLPENPKSMIGEVIIIGEATTDDFDRRVESYLSEKWGISLSEMNPYWNDPATTTNFSAMKNVRMPFGNPHMKVEWDVDVSNGHSFITGVTLEEMGGENDKTDLDHKQFLIDNGCDYGDIDYVLPTKVFPKKIYISYENGILTPQLRSAAMPIDYLTKGTTTVYKGSQNSVYLSTINGFSEETYLVAENAIKQKIESGFFDSSTRVENYMFNYEHGFIERYEAVVASQIKSFDNTSETKYIWIASNVNGGIGNSSSRYEITNNAICFQFAGILNNHVQYAKLGAVTDSIVDDYLEYDHFHFNVGYLKDNRELKLFNEDTEKGVVHYLSNDYSPYAAGHNGLCDPSQRYVHPNTNKFILSAAAPNNAGLSAVNPTLSFSPPYDVIKAPPFDVMLSSTSKDGGSAGCVGYNLDYSKYWDPSTSIGNVMGEYSDEFGWKYEQSIAGSGGVNPDSYLKDTDMTDFCIPWQDDNYASARASIYLQSAKGAHWYVIPELGDNRLYQSNVADPEVLNLSNYIEFNDTIKGLAEFNDKVIVFTEDDKINRVEGLINAGSGYLDSVAIDGVFDLISNKSIVRTPYGIFFASIDGFCFTDGVRALKITEHIPYLYKKMLADLGKVVDSKLNSVVVSHNPVDEYVLYEFDAYSNMVVIDLKQGISDEMPIYLWSYERGKSGANQSVYSNDIDKYLTFSDGMNLHFQKDKEDDESYDDIELSVDVDRVIARLETSNIYFDSKLQRKIVSKIVPTFEKKGVDQYLQDTDDPTGIEWVGVFVQPKINVDGRDDENLQPIDHTNIIKDVVTRRRFGNRPSQALLSNILTVSRRLPSRNTRGMYYTFILDEADITPKKLNREETTKSHFKLLNFSVLYAMLGDSANMTYTDAGSGDE